MALHGSVKINQNVIGGYSIRRKNPPFVVADTVCTYEWRVLYTDFNGHNHHYKGIITHRYGDGAFALISKVLAEVPNPTYKEE